MRFLRHAAAASAVFAIVAVPALAQTSGTPAPTPKTEQPGAGQLPDIKEQTGEPMREMIRQMIDQAITERMQQDRRSEVANNRQDEAETAQGDADRQGDRWRRHRDEGPAGEHRMAGHHVPHMMRGAGMRLMFAFLDTNGDESLSENEIQDAVGRIFSAVDQNGDGKIDMDEVQAFLHGSDGREMP